MIAGDLQQALSDCNESLRLRADDPNTLDSRGYAYFKLGQFDAAIADFDAAIARAPKLASSLYGRGLARMRKGDTAGDADIAAAKALQANIAEEQARYGIN